MRLWGRVRMRLHKRNHQPKGCHHVEEAKVSPKPYEISQNRGDCIRKREICFNCEKPECKGYCELMKGKNK